MQLGVYILESLRNGRYYIGSTNNLTRRITEHNAGLVKSTRSMRPFVLRMFIKRTTIRDARIAETRLKRYKSKKIIAKAISDATFPWEYRGLS